jgi:hypothetical protein
VLVTVIGDRAPEGREMLNGREPETIEKVGAGEPLAVNWKDVD